MKLRLRIIQASDKLVVCQLLQYKHGYSCTLNIGTFMQLQHTISNTKTRTENNCFNFLKTEIAKST